jgi:integrase
LTRFLAASEEHTPTYAPIFFLLSRTGLRPSEARALQWADYDPSGRSCGSRGPSVCATLWARPKRATHGGTWT